MPKRLGGVALCLVFCTLLMLPALLSATRDGQPMVAGDEPAEANVQLASEGVHSGALLEGVAVDKTQPGFWPAESAEPNAWADSSRYDQDTVLVRIPSEAAVEDVVAGLSNLECVDAAALSAADEALGYLPVRLAKGTAVAEALAALDASELVEGAQPDFVYHLLEGGTPAPEGAAGLLAADAASLSTQAISVVDEVAVSQDNTWWLSAVGAPSAWEQQTTSHAVTVAVIDTGCATEHGDLAANIAAPAYCYNALTGKTGAEAVVDADGHGTHVAGIIAAVPNEIGIAGVSYNAKIMPVKVIDNGTTDTAALLKAYRFVIEKSKADSSIRIVNVSLGGAGGYDPALMRAIDEAYCSRGILSVFAAGNDGEDEQIPYYCFPCDYSEVGLGVINVGKETSQTLKGSQESSSNYNLTSSSTKIIEKTKDLSAPGAGIYSTFPKGLAWAAAIARSEGNYISQSGTSMAAPVVSGIAALVAAKNPALSAGELKSVLCSTAADIVRANGTGAGFDANTGYGLVKADEAVKGANALYLKGNDAVAVGKTVALSVPTSGSWTWSSDTPAVATVSAAGVVTGVSHGEAVITATNALTGAKASRTIVVYAASLSGVATVFKGGTTQLAASVNPVGMVAWSSSDTSIATVGATTGVVTGRKAGTATITATLTCAPSIKVSKKVTVVKAKVTLSAKSYVYNGKVRKPAVKSVVVAGKKLKVGTHYTVSYPSGRKKAGTYTIKIKGKGAYSGTVKATFKIKKAANPIAVRAQSASISRRAAKKHDASIEGLIHFTKAAKGAVTYAKVAKGSSKWLDVDQQSGAIIVKQGVKAGSYKIKAKVRAAGTANYKARNRKVVIRVTVR